MKEYIDFQLIVSDNTGVKMCGHETCSRKPLYFALIDVNGVPFHIVACGYHAYEVMQTPEERKNGKRTKKN